LPRAIRRHLAEVGRWNGGCYGRAPMPIDPRLADATEERA